MKKNKPTRRVRKAYANAMVKHSSTPRGIAKILAMRSHSDSATMVAMTNHYCNDFWKPEATLKLLDFRHRPVRVITKTGRRGWTYLDGNMVYESPLHTA